MVLVSGDADHVVQAIDIRARETFARSGALFDDVMVVVASPLLADMLLKLTKGFRLVLIGSNGLVFRVKPMPDSDRGEDCADRASAS